jgi:hypothetical protein
MGQHEQPESSGRSYLALQAFDCTSGAIVRLTAALNEFGRHLIFVQLQLEAAHRHPKVCRRSRPA